MYSLDNIEIFILVAIVLFLIIHTTEKNKTHYDTWINYRQEPLGNIKTAPFKLPNYFRIDRYRKPYNFPVCQMTDDPVRHCKYFP